MWIGVDPGKATGIVLRDGDRLIWHTVVEGGTPEGSEVVPKGTIQDILEAIEHAENEALTRTGIHHIAVEGVIRPNAHHKGKLAFVDPFAVAAPSVVLGAVLAMWQTETVVIRPNGHGSAPLSTYPAELVTPGERRRGLNRPAPQSSTTRHARSAWDVAGAGPMALRIQTARAGAR